MCLIFTFGACVCVCVCVCLCVENDHCYYSLLVLNKFSCFWYNIQEVMVEIDLSITGVCQFPPSLIYYPDLGVFYMNPESVLFLICS